MRFSCNHDNQLFLGETREDQLTHRGDRHWGRVHHQPGSRQRRGPWRAEPWHQRLVLGTWSVTFLKMEQAVNGRINAASAVKWESYWTVVAKRELSWKAKLLIYSRSTVQPSHLVMSSDRMRSQIQAAEMSFLHRVSGLVWGSDQDLPGCHPREVFCARDVQLVGEPGVVPEHAHGLGTPWDPAAGAGKRCWGEERLSFAEPAATVTRPHPQQNLFFSLMSGKHEPALFPLL